MPIPAAEAHVIGATCLQPGSDEATAMLRLIADLKMPVCETVLYRKDVEPDRARKVRQFLDDAAELGVTVLLEPTYEPDLAANPAMCCVTNTGTSSDRGDGSWGGCCYRNAQFLKDIDTYTRKVCQLYGSHPAVLRHKGRIVIAIGHEMQYQVSKDDGHGGAISAMSCYCPDCLNGFVPWLNGRHGDNVEAPREAEPDRVLWQEWVDYHTEAIPDAIEVQRTTIESELPGALVTHEINDWYPNTWDCVYAGNNFWRMGDRLEHAFNDQYPMEWAPGSLWRIYLYTFTQDVTQSSIGFDRSFWTNGQAFAAWQGEHTGTRPPLAGYHEQIYSALIHGANGLIWWASEDILPEAADATQEMIRLVEVLGDARPMKDPIALLIPWTTYAQTRSEDRGDDLMSAYQLLARLGFQIETVDEVQVENGVLTERNYRALCTWGNSSMSDGSRTAIENFVREGGLLLADYGDLDTAPYQTVFPATISSTPVQSGVYTLPDGTRVLSRARSQAVAVELDCEVISRYDDGAAAAARYRIGKGVLLRTGTLAGVDYAAGMGLYDWARQERVRIEPAFETMIGEALSTAGITPLAQPANPNVEAAVFEVDGDLIVVAVNHLIHPLKTSVVLRDVTGNVVAADVLTGESVPTEAGPSGVTISLRFTPMGGQTVRISSPSTTEGDSK
jgi:hypothetical protein